MDCQSEVTVNAIAALLIGVALGVGVVFGWGWVESLIPPSRPYRRPNKTRQDAIMAHERTLVDRPPLEFYDEARCETFVEARRRAWTVRDRVKLVAGRPNPRTIATLTRYSTP